MTGERKPMVQIASLWERTSKSGNQYFSGFMNGAQLLMFRGEEITRDNGDVVQTWNLLVQERDQPRPETALAKRHRIGRQLAQLRRDPAAPAGDREFYDDSAMAVADLEGRGR